MISFPFDSQNGDRAVNSLVFRNIFKKYFTNGVFNSPSTEFFVQENSGMTVLVKKGYCNINGAIGYELEDRVLQIEASTGMDRIDSVVLRLDDNVEQRKIDLYVLKGTPSGTPTAPLLTRDSTVFELCLANIFVAKNTASVTQTRITDTRANSDVCGIVVGTVKELDTATIYAQIQAQLVEQKQTNQDDFDEWFDNVKIKLDSTVEAQILADIDTLKGNVTTLTSNKQNKVLSGTVAPSASLGVDGDIYILLES